MCMSAKNVFDGILGKKIQCKIEIPIFNIFQFFNWTLLPQSLFRRLENLKNHLSGRWLSKHRLQKYHHACQFLLSAKKASIKMHTCPKKCLKNRPWMAIRIMKTLYKILIFNYFICGHYYVESPINSILIY